MPTRLPPLTDRQREVLALMARGLTNFEIAQQLGISLEGAKYHVREILTRLGVDSRDEAARLWRSERAVGVRIRRTFEGLVTLRVAWASGLVVASLAALVGLMILVTPVNDGDGNAAPAADASSDTVPGGAASEVPTAAAQTASPGTTATATVDPERKWDFAPPGPCPLPGTPVCEAALELQAAMRSRDVAEVQALAEPISIGCPAQPGILLESVCQDREGETVAGFGAGKWGGAAGVEDAASQAVFLGDVLRGPFTAGSPTVGAVACEVDDAENMVVGCPRFAVAMVLSAPEGDGVLLFAFHRDGDGGWGYFGIVNWVPWDDGLVAGEPMPATFGLSPEVYNVPHVRYTRWTAP
jgi:DNA-binding CsgD family transcriptional regulator